jgi:hypothetical protein
VLLSPGGDVRFAGPVQQRLPYRSDDIFVCPKGHRRVVPSCACGFYAVADARDLRPSVVSTAVLEVTLEGRVVRHRDCMRGERQRVRRVTFDGWCSFCTAPAVLLAAIPSVWHELPEPWQRAVPVCSQHANLYEHVVTPSSIATSTEADVVLDRTHESRAAQSLRRQYRAVSFFH